MSAFGLVRGVAHTEFIKSHNDGQFYFLETAARVGGANIAEMVEAATGINLWSEWAKIELEFTAQFISTSRATAKLRGRYRLSSPSRTPRHLSLSRP